MKRKIFITFLMMIGILFLMTTYHYCDIDLNDYKDIYNDTGKQDAAGKIGGVAVAIAQTVGMGVAVFMLIGLGIKYMYSATEEKAKIKEKLIPYVIGATILFGASGFLKVIVDFIAKIAA